MISCYISYPSFDAITLQVTPHTLSLARAIQNELQLIVKDERVINALAVKMSQQIQTGQYSEAYFGELTGWIVTLKRCSSEVRSSALIFPTQAVGSRPTQR